MARIVLGIGSSHTPLLTLGSEHWRHRAEADYANQALNMSDGRLLRYDEVLAELGPRCAEQISPEILAQKESACNAALDHLADALSAARPDIVVIIGDDQRELFGSSNQPAIAIFHGAQIVTCRKFPPDEREGWRNAMARGYLMDDQHTIPGAASFSENLIRGLVDEDFDIAACDRVEEPDAAGFGHAYGFIVKRLFRGRSLPVAPVLLNTYYGPNVPSASRCWHFGQALRRVVEAVPDDLRVALIASGGLSHFVVDEDLDRKILGAMALGDAQTLTSIPRAALISGSSEILNWIALAGAAGPLQMRWHAYHPLYRTPAGTGVGAAFAVWAPDADTHAAAGGDAHH
ncbi:protocatechuate 3,4-dioxygenase [Hydrogenophaga intermedia]|uniref:DODA-type extradiol aromatic ring-opening family dioxygenase n=1 Tax=Hydrogenophaga intermedia TaxID=65786 RepID=UPI0020444265|nr:protocatechuate 3,4-dioxygenase [Hydrogenophaga intermedia]MCM3562834.1 protocatechuate 3,4-dioxygenase [Hydrogenophaga intermedia]